MAQNHANHIVIAVRTGSSDEVVGQLGEQCCDRVAKLSSAQGTPKFTLIPFILGPACFTMRVASLRAPRTREVDAAAGARVTVFTLGRWRRVPTGKRETCH
jgi:hypothetical protein